MNFKYFSKNGELLSIEQAVIPISSIEYSYGFGVYETIRVMSRVPYFLKDHLERLADSARTIDLEHVFSSALIEQAITDLIEKNEVETCNLKILLIGGQTPSDASLYILCLNPLFPDKKLYRDGAHCIAYEYERIFPHAKTLNMLGSYLAYRKARTAGAYDALLLNHEGCITEGTRTNFFCIKDTKIVSPSSSDILPGVTRKVLERVASKNGYVLEERDIKIADIEQYDGAFLTSTSTKIMPIRSVEALELSEPPASLRELMRLFDAFLTECDGNLTQD